MIEYDGPMPLGYTDDDDLTVVDRRIIDRLHQRTVDAVGRLLDERVLYTGPVPAELCTDRPGASVHQESAQPTLGLSRDDMITVAANVRRALEQMVCEVCGNLCDVSPEQVYGILVEQYYAFTGSRT